MSYDESRCGECIYFPEGREQVHCTAPEVSKVVTADTLANGCQAFFAKELADLMWRIECGEKRRTVVDKVLRSLQKEGE